MKISKNYIIIISIVLIVITSFIGFSVFKVYSIKKSYSSNGYENVSGWYSIWENEDYQEHNMINPLFYKSRAASISNSNLMENDLIISIDSTNSILNSNNVFAVVTENGACDYNSDFTKLITDTLDCQIIDETVKENHSEIIKVLERYKQSINSLI